MTFMRVTRDQRGYETTLLLHVPRPGDRPRVLYWYRTAPGVRVGRIALDEDAIRHIEEQHPDIEFDWPALLEEAESAAPEVERRPERPRRKPRPQEAVAAPAAPVTSAPARADEEGDSAPAPSPSAEPEAPSTPGVPAVPAAPSPITASSAPRNAMLDSLVGREIAARLRSRYNDIAARVTAIDSPRADWQARVDALDPDRWATPQAILDGVQHGDRLYEELRRELTDAPGDDRTPG